MNKKKKRFLALFLALTVAAPNVVWANTQQEIDVSGLKVSDAFAAKHPHGMFEVLSPYIMTGEGKEFDFYVLRRGGTEGEASVNIKAVEISAKYGEDFVLQEKDALSFYHDLQKSADNPTVLENQVELNKDVIFTTDRLASGAAIDVYTIDETASGAAFDAAQDNDTEALNTDAGTDAGAAVEAGGTLTIDEAFDKATEDEAPVTAYSDDMGSYTSALHKMHDEATGKTTPAVKDAAKHSLDDIFETQNKEQVQFLNDAAEAFDGLEYTVDFKDGEAYKIIHVKIIDDDVYEAQEAFSLALYGATNGAEIGEQAGSDIIIDDNENVEKSNISFASESYQVFSDADGVTVTLKREGNLNDYVNVYVSTLADSAKADEDYTPVMGEIMFLPGETEKKIYVPILKDNIAGKELTDSLYFDITAETEDNATITGKKTRVEILPFTNTDNKALLNISNDGAVSAYSDEDTPVQAYESSDEYDTWNYTGTYVMAHSVPWYKEGNCWFDGSTDLVGIERVTFKWSNEGVSASKYNSRQVSTVRIGSITKTKYKTFGTTNGEFTANDMNGNRGDNTSWKFNAYVSTDNAMNLKVWDIKKYYTKFNFLNRGPDSLTAYVYTGTTAGDRVSSLQFTPGTTTVSDANFRKYNYIRAYGNLNDDGRKYGCSVKNVTITGNNKSFTKSSGEYIYVNNDLIKNYIYNGDQAKSSLTAKASFERTERVNKINVAKCANGIVKLGGKVINDSVLTSDVWYKGDKIRLELVADQGYHVGKITADGKIYKQGDDIPLADNMTLNVEFARDDNSVAVVHDYVGTYNQEDLKENVAHGYVISPSLIGEKYIAPMTKEQFADSISAEQKKQALVEAYKKYIADNGLEEKFTNEIPLLYIQMNGYGDSNLSFDYSSKLKLDDYRKLVDYFVNNGVSQGVMQSGLKKFSNDLYRTLDNKKFKNDTLAPFKVKYSATGTCYISYNGKIFSQYFWSKLMRDFTDAMYNDSFGHLTQEQAGLIMNIALGRTGDILYDPAQRAVFAMVNADGTKAVKVIDEDAVINNKDVLEAAYQEYLKKYNEDKKQQASSIKTAENYCIKNLTTGDTVNLIAQLEKGYTCVWRYSDSAKSIGESDMPLYTIHVGDSFSFDIKDSRAQVDYYFVPVNEKLPDSIVRGRVIRPTQTLRTKGSERVDINNKSTYQSVQGLDITIGTLDSSAKGVVNGKTYYPTTTTDANGYFSVLVPHGVKGLMTNLIMANGEKSYVKHAVVLGDDKEIIFALPYQDDNIWVRSFEFNCEETKTEGIYVVDKNITLTSELDIAEGYAASQVLLRSYDCKGELVKAWQMDPQGGGKYTSTFNAKEYLRDGGRLTIEPYDAYGRGVGQVESGCIFTEPAQPTSVGMPAMEELGGANLDTVGEFRPTLDTGDYVMTPEKVEYDESSGTITTRKYDENVQPFEIAILSGNTIKNEINEVTKDGSDVFINGTAMQRVARLTAAIDPMSSDIILDGGKSGENTWSKPDGMGKVGAKGGKLAHSVGLDLGFYIRLYKKHNAKGEVKYYYDQMYILAGLNVNVKKDFQIFVGPVPCYISISGGISLKGIIGMVPNPGVDTEFGMDGIKMDADVLREGGMNVAGIFVIKPNFALGAGVGVRGAFSVGVSGRVVVNIVYQPWTDGAGTVQFSLNVDIDIGPIPITFAVAKVTLGMFYTENYEKNSWLDFEEAINKLDFDNYVKTLSADEDTEVRGSMGKIARGHGNTLETPVRVYSDEDSVLKAFAENNVRGTLKHPKPQLLHLGGGKQILFYLGDDLSRADYDCQALYYVLYDGSNWGQPQLVDDDGTMDMDFSAVQAGDRVMLVYSDMSKQFGNALPNMPDYLDSTDMSLKVFDENGNMGEEKQLTTQDGFANSMPRIAYDENTGRTLIAYLATDYNDSATSFAYGTMADLDNFLNNSYGTVCYKMLDSSLNTVGYSQNETNYLAYEEHYGEGSLDGQRFVPLADDKLNINEMAANTYGDKVYITYTVDTDGNSETSEDMELFASVIDINNNSSVGPVRLTTNNVQDSNPQTVEYDNKVYIYWNRDGNIVYGDLDNTLGGNIAQTNSGYTAGDMFFTQVQEGADAAQTFRVSYEPNEILYLTWNAVESHTEVIDDKEVPITKRSIYMRTFDPHYSFVSYTDEETGETKYNYSGMWGAATQFDVPTSNDMMYSEQTFLAPNKDTAMCAFRRFNWIETENGTKEAENADLVIHRYHVVSSLEVTDAYSDPQYPTIDDDAVLHINVKNVGVLPSESVTFKATMTDADGNVTDLGEDVVNTHLAASGEVEGTFTYKVPENGDSYKFNITAYEDNYTEKMVKFEKTFEKAPVIENIAPVMTGINNDREDISALFVNKGNKATGEMTFKVSARNNGEKSQLVELASQSVASLEPNETAGVESTLDISDVWGSGNLIRLYITLENADGALYDEIADINRLSDEDLDVTDIIVNDGDESTIEVKAGEWSYPHFEIAPVGASASNKLVYSISDSSIADIDPSNGRIYGKKEGTATITVSAVNSRYSLFVDEDDSTYDSSGSLVIFDENGTVNDPETADADGTVVMTKQIQVKVSGTISEETTEVTEATTEASRRSSGGGGGGGSSSSMAKKAAKENTTEETTANAEDGTETTTEDTADTYNGFTDVRGMWCEDIVNTLHSLGLVNGRTKDLFAPDSDLTRAELVQLLANLSGADLETYADADERFTDVGKADWYYAAVMWAADNNIVYGIGNDMFAPDTSITRQDTAAIIYRYLGIEAAAESANFTDAGEISAYAADAVNTLSSEGIINGYPDNTFRPKNTITRAEAASILYGVNER